MLVDVERTIDNLEALIEEHGDESGALETACHILATFHQMNSIFTEGGCDTGVGEGDPRIDLDKFEASVDGILGELSAAVLFLSEKQFARVPDMLRHIAGAVENTDVEFTDPTGDHGTSVPLEIVKGFRSLADRLERARQQQKEVIESLRKV